MLRLIVQGKYKKPRIYRGRVCGRKGCMLMSRLPALPFTRSNMQRSAVEGWILPMETEGK